MSRLQSAFVTGAGGFIGRHLVRQLLAEQVAVVALMMPGEPVPAEWGDRVRIVVGDVRRLLELREQIGPVDAIFHLAAVVSDWGSTQSHVEVTVKGTEHAIELALGWDAHFVVTTSVCAFASALAKGRLSEGSPVGVPSSAYEFCKQEQERVTREGVARGLKGTIVRPANVFGVGSMPWVNSLVQVMREGTPCLLGSGDWDAGLELVKGALARKVVSPLVAERARAALLAALAHQLEHAPEPKARAQALESAIDAAKLQPGFAPGVVMAARLLAAREHGLSPDEVATIILRGIADDRYVITTDEAWLVNAAKQRLAIAEGAEPPMDREPPR